VSVVFVNGIKYSNSTVQHEIIQTLQRKIVLELKESHERKHYDEDGTDNGG
jgi:hypothetical protein